MKSKSVSSCCKAEMEAVRVDDGTCFYMCSNCKHSCDSYVEPKLAAEPKWSKDLDRLCGIIKINDGQQEELAYLIERTLAAQKKELEAQISKKWFAKNTAYNNGIKVGRDEMKAKIRKKVKDELLIETITTDLALDVSRNEFKGYSYYDDKFRSSLEKILEE